MRTYVLDFESTGFKADIGNLLVACYGELDAEGHITQILTEDIQSIGKGTVAQREKRLAQWAVDRWTEADILIGQNHKAFDQKFLQGVMLRHHIDNGILPRRIMLDTYQIGKGMFGMSMSMGNFVDVIGIGKKDAPEKGDWREANHGDPEALARIRERCEADVRMTAEMWNVLKPTYMMRYGK